MFGHQDEEQTEYASAATAPVAADHSGDDNQQASDDTQTTSSDDNTDYLNSLASETLDHDHPEASETASPTVHDASGANISNNDFANGNSDASDAGDTNDVSSDNNDGQDDSSASIADDQLLDIKQQALEQLSPLVDHLDQTPEEKFKTTMMMIQAADNQSLIPDAYKAAKSIGDEKARAQALLDIVNEINYFTHKS